MTKTITREKLQEEIREGGLTLIEVLPAKYFNEGHIPSALQMNHDEIEEKGKSLLPGKDRNIVVYCASETCTNSELAAKQLIEKGYTRVRKYVGGKKDWMEAGLSLEI